MPRISEPFVLTGLPYSSKKDISPVKAAASARSSSVYLGISNSSITSYSLLPTPRLLWTHSIPPSSSITALETHKSQEDSVVIVGFGVHERKKHSVKLVTVDDSNNNDENNQLVKSFNVPYEVCGLGFSVSGERVYVILKNSCVQSYVNSKDEEITELWSSKTKASRNLVHWSFIPPSDEDGPEDGSIVLVSTRGVGRKSMIEVRVLALEPKGSYELISKEIEIPEQELKYGLALAYHEGLLYRYSGEERKIYAYPILGSSEGTGNIYSRIFSVPAENEEKKNPKESLTPSLIAIGRCLFLSHGKSVSLIDTRYNTIISQKVINDPLTSILGFVESSSTIIGTSSLASSTFASANSTHSVIGINVDTGKGTLLESIGKGIGEESDPWRLGYSDIFIKKNYTLREYSSVINDIIVTAQDISISILEDLSGYKNKKDIVNFEHKSITYLKGKEWEDIEEISSNEKEIFAYESKDRDVDREFIFELVDLIFDNSDLSSSSSNSLKLNSEFIPEKLIIYLLTHPLFPTPELPGLLDALSTYPRLLRQAIVTAPAIECFDLIDALSLPDNEIFRDIVNRILEEFGQEEIFESIKLKYGTGENKSKDTLEVVNRLIKLDVGWQLIPCFVDVGGLFGWDHNVIGDLYKTVTSQVEALVSSAEIMTLIDETLRKFDSTADAAEVGRRSKKALSKQQRSSTAEKARKGPELISSEQREQERMRNLLKFGVETATPATPAEAALAKKKKAIRQGNLISRRVPLYSVEKLVL